MAEWERSFEEAAAPAFNRMIIDIARRYIDFDFDFAKSLAGAKTLAEAKELHEDLQKQLGAWVAQAEELRSLSDIAAKSIQRYSEDPKKGH